MQPTLPTPQDVTATLGVTPYDNPPWNVGSQGFRNNLEGFIGPGMHNAAHMWVGGSMMPATSPNDPVFFLHHANVDRIWANWQRQWFKSGKDDYLPVSGGPTGHNLTDGMFPWGAPSTPDSVLDTFALGYWYDDAPAPAVSSLNPATGADTGGDTVVITGAGFMGTTAVTFGTTPASAFAIDSDTQITAISPAGTGAVDVTVTTLVGTSPVSQADQFTYTAATGPQVTGISPTSGSSAGGDTIIITGSGFTGATGVSFDSTPASAFTVDSDTQITAISPAGTGIAVDITVTTPAGTSPPSRAGVFTYITPGPLVTGISPTMGSSAGGDTVVITGSGFTGATTVGFDVTSAADMTVDSDTQITAISPAGTGTVDITVTTPDGTSPASSADQFTYM